MKSPLSLCGFKIYSLGLEWWCHWNSYLFQLAAIEWLLSWQHTFGVSFRLLGLSPFFIGALLDFGTTMPLVSLRVLSKLKIVSVGNYPMEVVVCVQALIISFELVLNRCSLLECLCCQSQRNREYQGVFVSHWRWCCLMVRVRNPLSW